MATGRTILRDSMTVVSDSSKTAVAEELDALTVRVHTAKAGAQARADAIAAAALPADATPPPPRGRGDRRRWRTGLIVALLVVLGAGAIVMNTGDEGPGPTPVPPSRGDVNAPPPPEPAAPATRAAAAPDMEGPDQVRTVVVESGGSFWTIAEQEVSARVNAPTTAQVASYWAELVEANRGRLVHAGNPDLIYPGQTFSAP